MDSDFVKTLIITLMLGGCAVIILKQALQWKAQMDYERAFIRKHRAIVNRFQTNDTTPGKFSSFFCFTFALLYDFNVGSSEYHKFKSPTTIRDMKVCRSGTILT